jgi:hypothetical protein
MLDLKQITTMITKCFNIFTLGSVNSIINRKMSWLEVLSTSMLQISTTEND